MLYKVEQSRYPEFIAAADTHNCGRVYPLSIAEGMQEGDIFTSPTENDRSILFWAHCGFAYLSGKAGECLLEELYALMSDKPGVDSRRFLLITRDESVSEYFRSKHNALLEKRYLYRYSKSGEPAGPLLPPGYELKEIDSTLLGKISGRITPALFWRNTGDFLAKGKGYCLTHGSDIASWAFSAAISSREIDIGVETDSQYKRRGLGAIAAGRMVQYAAGQGKEPVWACRYANIASQKTAEKLGFVKASECFVIKCKPA